MNISGPSQSRRRWSTRAVHHCVQQRCRSGRSSPCRQRETHRADHQSSRHILEPVHLWEDGKKAKTCGKHSNLSLNLAMPFKMAAVKMNYKIYEGPRSPPTPRFTADSVAKAGTNQLIGALVLNPSLADEVPHATLCATWSILAMVWHRRLVDRRLNVGDDTGASAWNLHFYVQQQSQRVCYEAKFWHLS